MERISERYIWYIYTYIHTHISLNHFAVQLKHCKSTVLRFKKKPSRTLNLDPESCILKGKRHTEGLEKKPSSSVDKDYNPEEQDWACLTSSL